MDLATIAAIRDELDTELRGREFGKVFQLSKVDLAIDLRPSGSRYLFISIEPANPRVYLIKRRLRDLEKASVHPTQLALLFRKHLSGAKLERVEQWPDERVLLFRFIATDETDKRNSVTLAAQLTGASANLFLLDGGGMVVSSGRKTLGQGQNEGEQYSPPQRLSSRSVPKSEGIINPSTGSLSELLDQRDLQERKEKRFKAVATAARSRVKGEIARRRKLFEKLKADLAGHGDPERWKRFGDLLLANQQSGRREEDHLLVTDYFATDAPPIAIPVDENDSVTEAAEKYFRKYSKARNAKGEIEARLVTIGKELDELEIKKQRIEEAFLANDEEALREFTGAVIADSGQKRAPAAEAPDGTRRFVSSDGFEILVGKKAKDNDYLTFRIAKSLDTWMHAADYPGSHVVIRNPNRKELPSNTLVEAAQLTAFYSQGKTQPKAAVRYTQRKFVNKPKGAPPGTVRLAKFKTILVEPKIPEKVTR